MGESFCSALHRKNSIIGNRFFGVALLDPVMGMLLVSVLLIFVSCSCDVSFCLYNNSLYVKDASVVRWHLLHKLCIHDLLSIIGFLNVEDISIGMYLHFIDDTQI